MASEPPRHLIIGVEPAQDPFRTRLWLWFLKPERSNAFTAIATVVYAGFTIILALFAIFQGWQLWTSMADTQRLLNTLEKQAAAQSKSADEAAHQANALNMAVEEARNQAVAAKQAMDISLKQANAVLAQAEAARTQNKTSMRPIVAFYTQTIEGKGNLLMVGNFGFGPALNVVTYTMTRGRPLSFLHRIFLGAGQQETVTVPQIDTKRLATQEDVTVALINMKFTVTVCISYVDGTGYPYRTWQTFRPLPAVDKLSKDEFSIEFEAPHVQNTPCVIR